VSRRPWPTAAAILALESRDGIAESAEYHRAVEAALPDGVTASAEFWFDLEDAANIYLQWELRRLRKPPLAERKRWQRIVKLTDDLARELRVIRQRTFRTHSNPDWAKDRLQELWRIKRDAETYLRGYSDVAAGYGRRRSTSRAFLYASVLGLWTKRLGQPLRFSITQGVPTGPLIRFFAACVTPIMGNEALTARAICKIIERARHCTLDPQK
jgi:hypothetical protein